jgi:hypothetical protein
MGEYPTDLRFRPVELYRPAAPMATASYPRSYPLMKASRSALIVAASVVGMPCGKPL